MTPAHPPDPPPLATPIGAVVPYDMALDRELRQFSRDRFGFEQLDLLFARTPFQPLTVTVEQARAISRPEVIRAAVRSVSATGPAGYIYACTSGSFVRGVVGERRLTHLISETGRKASAKAMRTLEAALAYPEQWPDPAPEVSPTAVTTAGSLLEALHALGVTSVAAATPYDPSIAALFQQFFAEAGIDLVHTAHLGLAGRIWTVPWDTTRDLVRNADAPDAEAVLISCTNLPTYEVLDQLEQDLGKPVLSANQTTIWAALRRAEREYLGPGAALRDCFTPAPTASPEHTREGAAPA
ncbi:maleate cis-trans isomerase family protein [Nesterenkonia sphaerica]|uniref:maleate cis-trans isomerase family protein n=1 Tax=Nesterenkonia sphaerica TaxID=1804988 RepID=UPI0014092EBA|nr:Asp/Glu racemase [Nesterenkonia sphaerica]